MVAIQKDAESQIIDKQKIVDFDMFEFTIEYVVSKYLTGLEEDENDIYIPTYQRNFVWNKERQSKFIESLLLGLPSPPMFTADTGDGRLEIIDGSQRLRTLADFIKGKLQLKKMEILTELNGFRFNDLTKSRQRKFKNTTIRLITLTDKSDAEVRFILHKRLNNTP